MKPIFSLLLLLLLFQTSRASTPETKTSDEWAYLDNGHIRIGIKKASGAAIGWLSRSGSDRNLINHFDRGRLIQQSYYGDVDGSLWNKRPWRWNPVQGGDWHGSPAKVLEIKLEREKIYARTEPRHWAAGQLLPDVTMEEWIDLAGDIAHVRYKMSYTGTHAHAPASQEIPAFFTEPDLQTLVLYDGGEPWTNAPLSRSKPGWPNESRRMTENWAAYVDDHDFGVGAYVPAANHLTCYRYVGGKSSCSYFAPLTTLAITPGFVFDYDVYLAVGTSTGIRDSFREVRKSHPTTRPGGE